jgi:hypothetical protein
MVNDYPAYREYHSLFSVTTESVYMQPRMYHAYVSFSVPEFPSHCQVSRWDNLHKFARCDIERYSNRPSGGCQRALTADETHRLHLDLLVATNLGLNQMFLAASSCLGVAQGEIHVSYNLTCTLMMPACEVSMTTQGINNPVLADIAYLCCPTTEAICCLLAAYTRDNVTRNLITSISALC